MDSKEPMEEDTKKLTFVVIFMLLFVTVLFGFGQ